MAIFRRIRDSHITDKIVGFLKENEAPELQFESIRYICYYCQGPRIPNTPIDSTLHPSKMFHKAKIINAGGVIDLENIIGYYYYYYILFFD